MPFSKLSIDKVFERRIQTHLSSNKLGKSYIISGGSESDISDFSLFYAMAIVCEESLGDFCGKCQNCRMIQAQSHPDVKIYISEKKTIGIETARKVQEDSSQTTYKSKRRVNIIPNAHLMTVQAQNSLLKTLEDGTRSCVTLLLTTNPDRILDTIHSRSIAIKLPPNTNESVISELEKKGLERKLIESELVASNNDTRWLYWYTDNTDLAQSVVDIFDEKSDNYTNSLLIVESEEMLHGISLVLPQIVVRSYRQRSGIIVESPLLGKAAEKLAKLDDTHYREFIEEYRNTEKLWMTQTRKTSLVQTTLMNLWI